MDKFYLSTIDENAHILAKHYGLGIELAEFCTPWFLDAEFDRMDPIIREKLRCADRFVLHGPFSEIFPCAIDPKIQAVAAERYRQTIRVAMDYGVRKLVIHGGYNPRIYYPIWYTRQSVRFWQDFVREIPEGMTLCLENVFEEEPEMIAGIIRQVDDPRLRMCLDVGHVNAYSGVDVMDWLDSCAHIIDHFHIHNNDGTRDSHSQLWEGSIPMERLLAAMERKCPDATVTLELPDAAPSVRWLFRGDGEQS